MAEGDISHNPKGAHTAAGGKKTVAVLLVQLQGLATGQHQGEGFHLS